MRLPKKSVAPLSASFLWILLASCTDGNDQRANYFPVAVGGTYGNCATGTVDSGASNSGNGVGSNGSALTGSTGSGNGTSTTGSTGGGNGTSTTGSTGSGNGTSTTGSTGSGNGTSTTGSTGSGGRSGTSVGGVGGVGTLATAGSSGTTFVVPADAAPTPASSGKNGAFRVNTNTGKLMHDGVEFQVRGGNWFGLEGQDDLARPGAMELYIGSVFWADAANKRTIKRTMDEIRATPLGLNTIRLPVAPQTLVSGHPDGLYSRTDVKIRNNDPAYYPYADALEALEDFLVQANSNGLYVILDMHSCSNHIGWRAGQIDDGPPWTDANRVNYKYKKENYTCKTGEDAYDVTKWLTDIHTLARLPKKLGIKNIIGIDCFNEPFKYTWSAWADLAKQCYDAIAAEDDDLIAVVEGVSNVHFDAANNSSPEPFGDVDVNPNWGENLYGQQFDPIQIPKDRLCFSPHTYGPSVYVQKQFIDQTNSACVGLEDDAAGNAKCKLVVERSNAAIVAKLRRGWDQHFGYLADQKYCVLTGEFGGYKGWPANPVKPQAATIWAHLPSGIRYDWEWQNIFVDYLKSKGMTDFTYWSVNPESGDTGGLYNHAYTLSNESGWGVWQGLDSEKVTMLSGLK
jgi:endoglucanase